MGTGSKPKQYRLYSVGLEASRHFRNKKKEYLKAKIDEIETNRKIKILGTCTGASLILRMVIILELIE